ncbi:transposase [Flammeovirga yaeyamensis]|uniref:Transposase n=1 Tax=Flammeovirga yaeyamensis TaxID=367791 RepID=A0AAX1N6S2_9BACT|nr:transposase [Flammeovirga yaeyamensis]MBB3697538.1 REP element-mobilizing transposase RayT [Flammeovirga yaeyamensis]NMF36232.1 transposase [Flammeovirga yaeyamensis]QWG02961.1 transposase [Flammeovirga yaeyamensis]
MARAHSFYDKEATYFVTISVVYWIDVFTREEYRNIIIDSLKYCQKHKDLKLHAYVIMSNHIHLIITKGLHENLSDILRDFKKFTSKTIIKSIQENPSESRKDWMIWMFKRAGQKNTRNREYQFWQQHNQPVILNSNEKLSQRLNYIHDNPIKAGLVLDAKDYLYSSASNYHGAKYNLLKVDFL